MKGGENMPKKVKYPKVRTRNGVSTYRYDIVDPATGARIQKETHSFATEKEAYEEGLRIESELRQGIFVTGKNYRVSEWIDKWLEIYGSSGRVKERTVEVRKNNLVRLRKEMGGLKLRDIDTFTYESFLNNLKIKHNLSYNTISSIHSAARLMFKKAKALKLIQNSPTDDAEIPAFVQTVEEIETGSELPSFLEKEQLALFLKTAANSGQTQYFHALVVLAYTGLRIGELCALRITDSDQLSKRLSVTKTLYRTHGIENYKLVPPKTKSGIRKVDLGKTVLQIIRKQEAFRNEFKMLRRDQFHDKNEFLFINEYFLPGYPLSPTRLGVFMKKIIKKANLPESITPHSLRHTYTSLMAEAGVDLVSIQKMLGHKKNRTTELVYLHVTETRRREAVDKLDSLMDGLF